MKKYRIGLSVMSGRVDIITGGTFFYYDTDSKREYLIPFSELAKTKGNTYYIDPDKTQYKDT